MILFFRQAKLLVYAVDCSNNLQADDIAKLTWLFGGAKQVDNNTLEGIFIGYAKR